MDTSALAEPILDVIRLRLDAIEDLDDRGSFLQYLKDAVDDLHADIEEELEAADEGLVDLDD